MARKTRQVETRMVSEYLKLNYSKHPFIIGQPLGKVNEQLAAQEGVARAIRITRPFRPECDAVVIMPRYLLIIEAKVWNIVNGLAKLPVYKALVPHTPELKQYLPREIIMQLVVGWSNDNLDIMAQDMGVEVKIYSPQWLSEVVEGLHKYWTPEYQEKRQKTLEMREYFGVE
ncbi:MAG: hypothetical protein HYX96_06180 [Chloroflexi bacterium]|nr:hypothetical protein [Chloroflexota bacterium]